MQTVPVETRPGWFEQYLPTTEEAIRRLRALQRNKGGKRRSVFIHVEQRGYTNGDSYFPIMGNIPVSRQVAEHFLKGAYATLTERGAHIRLVWCEAIVFVG